jgi:hypothetical protein
LQALETNSSKPMIRAAIGLIPFFMMTSENRTGKSEVRGEMMLGEQTITHTTTFYPSVSNSRESAIKLEPSEIPNPFVRIGDRSRTCLFS